MSDSIGSYIGAGIAIVVGGFLFFKGFSSMNRYRLIKDTPTSKIRSMAMGLVELHATVYEYLPCKAPYSQTPCAFYKYKVEEYRRHTTIDSKGKRHTHYRWDTIASGASTELFQVKDDTGVTYINPQQVDADIHLQKRLYESRLGFNFLGGLFSRSTGRTIAPHQLEDISDKEFGLFSARWSKEGDRRYYEYFLLPDDPLYVLGTAANDSKVSGGVVVRKGENEKEFCIATKTEKEMLKTELYKTLQSFVFGSLLLIGGIVFLFFILGMLN